MGRQKIDEEIKKANKAEYMRKYWKEHRKEQDAAVKRWREKHPEEARKRNTDHARKWREKNREKYNAYQKAYRAKQKAKGTIEDAIYEALHTKSDFSEDVWCIGKGIN